MNELSTRRKIRGGHRGSATKMVTKIEEKLVNATQADTNWLKQSRNSLNEKIEVLKTLDNEIINLLGQSEEESAEDEIVKEVEETDNLRAELSKIILDVDTLLLSFHPIVTPPTPVPSATPSPLTPVRARLPKLEVKKFNGKAQEWQEFWDSFESSIDKNESLSAVDKFSYLRGLLEEPAKSTIAGFSLTNTNYASAVELLKNRYGNKSSIQRAHINELMKMQPVFNEREVGRLRRLYDTCESHHRGLKALGVDEASYSAIVVPMVLDKLPEQFRFTITRGVDFLEWKMEQMLTAFYKELQLREIHNAVSSVTLNANNVKKSPSTASALLTSQDSENCAFCLKKHPHEDCVKVRDPISRKNLARKYARCFKCLKKGHKGLECKAYTSCKKCGGNHHVALCDPRGTHTQHEPNSSTCISSTEMHIGSRGRVALQTAQGMVKGENDLRVRVLFDSGSQRSFITSKAAGIIKPRVIRKEWLEVSTFGQTSRNAGELREVVELRVTPLDGKKVIVIEAYVVPDISNIQNNHVELEKREYLHLANLWFSDVCRSQEVIEIDVLVGSDYLWRFQRGETRRGKSDEPVAVQTELGWVLSGPLGSKSLGSHEATQVHLIEQVRASKEDSLVREVQKFWDLETLGIKEDNDVHDSFLDSVSFTGERYSVRLPWKEGHEDLSDNYANSCARMNSQLRKLRKEPEVLKEYDSVIREQLNSGIIERVGELEKADRVHYLPHHGVVRRAAATTKLRVVYDASSKGRNGVSLNDCLHVGPPLNPLLFDILLRFRMNKVALVGDIEKAFLNIEVDTEDRDCLRFLWVESISDSKPRLAVYRFCRVVFGLNSSPFLLNATLRHHILKFEAIDPEFSKRMLDSFYVDDLVTGDDTVEAAHSLYRKAKSRLASGGFRLRKWLTNNRELQKCIELEEQGNESVKSLDDTESYAKSSLRPQGCGEGQKVLGQSWDIELDNLTFELSSIAEKGLKLPPTKRNVLSVLAGVFDPLGVLSPVVVCAKILFQEICGIKGIQWDEELTGDVKRTWEKWCQDLRMIGEIKLSRCVFECNSEEVLECYLHGFGDASKKAYCAVIYLAYRTSQGVHVRFLTSKTRVTPLKTLSIPRLELMSARILAQLMRVVKGALESQVNITGTKFWLDSKTALYWIRNRGEWKQFVQHRVNEILKLTRKSDWGHCPGEENPADLGSRGVLGTKLKESELWWRGPAWLSGSQEGWPSLDMSMRSVEISEEERRTTGLVVQVDPVHNIGEIVDVNRYSRLERLLRVTAWIRRFVRNARIKKEERCTGRLGVKELLDAEIEWIECVQLTLRSQSKFLQLERSLGLVNEEGVLRCKGRLGNSQLVYDSKHPIILPGEHKFTEMVILKYHQQTQHSGVRATLAEIRLRYWVPKGRQVVKKILGRCVTCKRLEGKSYSDPPVVDLPEFRVTEAAPFSKSGVDFAGPLFIKGGATDSKVYIALFTCCVTRAVHLDLVEKLSAPAFIRCLRKFAARRGTPRLMISDNAKTFKAVEKELKELYNHPEVQADLETRRITWRFNMERAPWWGGFFERMVGCVKRCLRKVLGGSRLSYDELLTALVEIENTLNSRPLTYVYDELGEEALTPFHLIYGRRLRSVPDFVVEEDEDGESSSKLRFKYLSVKLGHFWSRWQREYLVDLREFHRCKLVNKGREVKKGDVVVVDGENLKRSSWKVAVIENVIKGKDGEPRGARVRIIVKGKPKFLNRPVQKLYPLEIQAEIGDENVKGVGGTQAEPLPRRNPKRAAAAEALKRIQQMVES